MSAGSVVVVSYYFPPLVGIASERADALRRHLRELGWEPVVITARDGFYHRTGETPAAEAGVVRTASLELSRALRRGYSLASGGPPPQPETVTTTVEAVSAGGLGERLRRLVRDFVYVPDAQVGWIPFAAAAASRAARAAPSPRVLFSTSVPFSAHLAAMAAARRAGVPWIAELRDPWAVGLPAPSARAPLRRRLDRGIERRVLLGADHVVVTSNATRLELLAAHPALAPERISVVTNGFEPIPERDPPPREEPMTILHAGTIAPGEDVAPVLAALDEVHARLPGAFRLRLLGPPVDWQPLAGAPARPWLAFEGVVSPERAREAMSESSVLLLVRGHPDYRLILPGKAFEYIGARRPILAVVSAGSEMESLLSDHADARLIDPGHVGELAGAVERLLEEHGAGHLQAPRVAPELTAPLRRSEQVGKLAQIFSEHAR